jgi:nitrite reductase (cytochrome c-552)
VVEVAKDIQHGMGCIQCHDPHGAQPRVVRDALIQAITRPEADTLWHKDPKRTEMKVVDFDGFRKIGVLQKYDSKLQCGQCHVEYNCNPGFEPESGDKVTMADRRTNHFPYKNTKDLLEHYDKLKFRDFTHAVTGAKLIKLQHPEMETYWGSVHDQAGVQCHDCHMPQKTNKSGKTYTSHQVVRPLHHVQDSCMGCHPDSSVGEMEYQIESVRNYTKGKMRKAEAAILDLIDTYAAAKKAGVTEDVLAQARKQHEISHVLWEWWTAENSDGWHNPKLAKETLIDSIVQAKKGTEILRKAMADKVAAQVK